MTEYESLKEKVRAIDQTLHRHMEWTNYQARQFQYELDRRHEIVNEVLNYLLAHFEPNKEKKMDKAIRKIEKEVKHTGKALKHLEKEDKKHDKVIDKAKKIVKKKKK